MMDEELAECLLMWVQTFSVEGERDSVQALAGGAALAQILNEVSPSFFTEEWMAEIKTEQAINKHIKISNLKKILKAVISFYDDEIGMRIHETKKPNLKMIVENTNLLEMGRLLQLVLGCAVNCDNKQNYIQAIMGMEESVQHGVMTAIQELMTQDNVMSPNESDGIDIATQLINVQRELAETKQANADLSQRCGELDLQVASLLEEKSNLEHHGEPVTDKSSDDLDDPNTASGKKYLALQQQLEQYKDEVYRLDAAKEDYRIKYDFSSKELDELKDKVESLTALAEEARSLKDEVDVLRQNEEKIRIYESTIESYKRKLEDMTDLRRTVKMLEEKNTSYMEKSVEWEEESKKTSALKSQVEVYKRQVQDLQSKVTVETKRADKSDFEMKRLQEKMSTAQTEKERLSRELQVLKENNEELQFSRLQGMSTDANPANRISHGGSPLTNSIFSELNEASAVSDNISCDSDTTSSLAPGDDDLELLSLPPALKEKYIRLQTENRMLNKKIADGGDTTAVQSLLDDAQSRVNELESEGRLSNQRMMELEAQVEDLQEASQKVTGDGDATKELKRKLTDLTQKVRSLESELGKKKQHIETADTRIGEFTQQVREKDEKLQQRENEMREMEEKYKKYLEKAKTVINKMEASQSTDPNISPQLEILRTSRKNSSAVNSPTKPVSSLDTFNSHPLTSILSHYPCNSAPSSDLGGYEYSTGSDPVGIHGPLFDRVRCRYQPPLKPTITTSSSPTDNTGQVLEKEKLVAQIQKESERQKSMREQEEKLMVSAWYNMGMNLHRKAVEDRLNQYTSGQSFLARQRQVHSKRAGAPLTPSNR